MPDLPVLDDDEPDDPPWDDEHDDLVHLKYLFEGVGSIVGLSAALRSYADHLDARAADGWRLLRPVDGGYAHLARGDG